MIHKRVITIHQNISTTNLNNLKVQHILHQHCEAMLWELQQNFIDTVDVFLTRVIRQGHFKSTLYGPQFFLGDIPGVFF